MSINWEYNAKFSDHLRTLFKRWKPLEINHNKELIWDYKEKEDIAVIYRFVIGNEVNDDVFTIYVGSGNNLSGDRGRTSLVYQYRNGNRKKTIRPKIEKEIEKFKNKEYDAWTEIIELNGSLRNIGAIIENIAIAKYWLEYIKRLKEETDIPQFLNEKIEKLGEITNLLIDLGIVE